MYFISDSLQFCWDQGGYLAEVTSAEEQQALDLFLLNGADYWLGLSDLEEEGLIILEWQCNVAPNTVCCRSVHLAGEQDGG